jgi:hypothetical protein
VGARRFPRSEKQKKVTLTFTCQISDVCRYRTDVGTTNRHVLSAECLPNSSSMLRYAICRDRCADPASGFQSSLVLSSFIRQASNAALLAAVGRGHPRLEVSRRVH